VTKRTLILGFLVAASLVGPSAASAPKLIAHADLLPTGCSQAIDGTLVKVTGCVARASLSGKLRGRLELRYTATVDLTRGKGTQAGTLTVISPSGKDRLVASYRGAVTINSGLSQGSWSALARTGAFARLAGRAGTYVSRTPDQGVHVSFDVRG
jgi:adhesin HecA-like repeat protein